MATDGHLNLTLLTDFYELTMTNGYLENGLQGREAVFDMFFRTVPDGGGYAIMAGVEQLVTYLQRLTFTEEDLAYLRQRGLFSEAFLAYLKDFRIQCDVWAVPEGTPIFPGEPIVTVRGPVLQAQFIENMVLLSINHQSLIATKANRIARAAAGRPVLEFGSRRAQGADGALLGARAAYIGGCAGTACALAERRFGIPAMGTMAHSWVQMFPDELEAFRAYARPYPGHCTLLVAPYNVLKSGVPNAIRAFQEEVVPRGFRPGGIRIDSGDITYLSREARKQLDAAGFADCPIVASNALDEWIIRDLLVQGAAVDLFGVGERLITSRSEPVFGGVYKLAASEGPGGALEPRIKLSENVGKITNPGFKALWRLFDRETGMALADVVTLAEEIIDDTAPYELFDPVYTWKRKTLRHFRAQRLLEPLFRKGQCCFTPEPASALRARCAQQVGTLWEAVLRFENPHSYIVDLSPKLWALKQALLTEHGL